MLYIASDVCAAYVAVYNYLSEYSDARFVVHLLERDEALQLARIHGQAVMLGTCKAPPPEEFTRAGIPVFNPGEHGLPLSSRIRPGDIVLVRAPDRERGFVALGIDGF